MKTWQHAVLYELEQALQAARLRGDFVAMGRRALVAPEDRGTQHVVVFVERDQAVHLAAQPDALHRAPVRQAREHFRHGLVRRAPPVLGVLLGPAGRRLITG